MDAFLKMTDNYKPLNTKPIINTVVLPLYFILNVSYNFNQLDANYNKSR
jgi:hypothetical protein